MNGTHTISSFRPVEAVASELGTTPIGVRRLIARERLQAVTLGTGPKAPWRVSSAELDKYIGSGCPDLACPDLKGDWFGGADCDVAAGVFLSAMQTAIAAQIPEEAPAADEVQVALSNAMRAAMIAPPVKQPGSDRDGQTFPDAFSTYAVQRLRFFARKAMANTGKVAGGVSRLYESPAVYSAVTGKAMAKLLSSAISITHRYITHDDGVRDVSFMVPMSAMMDRQRQAQALQLAF